MQRTNPSHLFLALSFIVAWPIALSCKGEDGAADFDELKKKGAESSRFLTDQETSRPVIGQSVDLERFRNEIKPILIRACADCHGADMQEGNVRIDTLDPDLVRSKDVDWWLEVFAVLSNGEMPPPDEGDLEDADRSKVIDWLSNSIQVASAIRRSRQDHSSFRRMTRYESNYALQDLLGVPWDFARDLPPEAHSEDGFQNSSELLHMTVMQFETYRELARDALRRATPHGERPPALYWGVTMTDLKAIDWAKQEAEINAAVERLKKEEAEEKEAAARLEKEAQEAGQGEAQEETKQEGVGEQEQPNEQEETGEDDAEQVKEPERDWEAERAAAVAKLLERYKTQRPRGAYFKELSTGRMVGASWRYAGARHAQAPSKARPELPETFPDIAVLPRNGRLTIELGDQVPNEGTLRIRIRASRASSEKGPAHVPSLQVLFGWQASNEGRALMTTGEDIPIEATSDDPQIYQYDIPLGEIYPRNSVRGVSTMGVTPSPSEYIRIVNHSVTQGDIEIHSVEIEAPVYDEWPPASYRTVFSSDRELPERERARSILRSAMPRIWRRSVTEQEVLQKLSLFDAMRPHCDEFEDAMVEVLATVFSSPQFLYLIRSNEGALTEHELATRLSMFLWCSVPDERLLKLAEEGRLHDPAVYAAEVNRMIADPRSKRFSKHFVHQWLDLQLLDFLAVEQFEPRIDQSLKDAMTLEPIALFHEFVQSDESVLGFIHADFTMANERLARHYGIANVFGNQFRRVPLQSDRRRGGLLTNAGLLAMNSDGKDSNPLKRGIWLLESLLNDPPPPPPPAVPEIDLADPEIAKMTLKERIEDHRNHAACQSCHVKIDPWGIAFENYDALGRWRTQIKGKPVDASSKLFNDQELGGMDGLKRFLLEHRQDQFVRALVHKITTYAVGRPLTFSDRANVDKITAEVRREGDGLATILRLVATSELFQSK